MNSLIVVTKFDENSTLPSKLLKLGVKEFTPLVWNQETEATKMNVPVIWGLCEI